MPSRTIRVAPRFAGLALAVIVALSPQASQAQKVAPADPENIVAARELMSAAGATKQFDTVVPTMVRQMAQVLIRQKPEHRDQLQDAFDAIGKRMNERKEELIVQIAELYAQQFTLAELHELTQFFQSGVGRRFVQGQQTILPRSMALGQQWGAQIGREVNAELRKEMHKRGIPL